MLGAGAKWWESPIMVNGQLPDEPNCICRACRYLQKAVAPRRLLAARTPPKPALYAFAQILGKFHFFKLRENLQRILLDYGQKRPSTANAAFKAAC